LIKGALFKSSKLYHVVFACY